METHKIHIMGIAPYEAMKTMMQKLAEKRPEISLDVYVGDLKKGVEIAQQNFSSNYDVIISRGGTAEMVGKSTNIPVIEVGLSVYDILRAIKLAENYADRYAIIGFPSITSSAHLLCDLLQYNIDIVTIHSADEVEDTLRGLKQNGYRMILCDMIANTTAKKLGLNAILITSGNESIESAFDQAVKLSSSYIRVKEENRFLQDILRGESNHTIIFDSNKQLFFSTWEGDSRDEVLNMLRREIPEALECKSHKVFRNINGTLYSITSRICSQPSQDYVVFYMSSNKIPLTSSKYGIQFSSKDEVEDHLYNSFYGITGTLNDVQNFIDQAGQSSLPIMVTGEEGTGKDYAVQSIYTHSQLMHNPMITINCSLINDKSWSFLTNHYNSPLNDNNNTIFFKGIDKLPESRRKQLLSIIIDMNLCKRNHLIFSCVSSSEATISSKCLEFVNLLSCLTLHMRPLRECTDKIPTLSSLYLSSLNVILAKQIIGFEPEALAMMMHYDWPNNHMQFKRVLNELAVLTTTPYISTRDVKGMLGKEQASTAGSINHSENDTALNLNRRLDEITREIIRQVLAENGGNQSAAAKQLGISRTTLWRYLK